MQRKWATDRSGIKKRVSALGVLLMMLTACGGPQLSPLQSQYRREQERALRYHALGELPRALRAYQDSLHWAEISDDRAAITAQTLNVGAIALMLGDWALAEQSFRRAQRTSGELQDAAGALQAQLGLAQIGLRQSRWTEAEIGFRQVLQAAHDRDTAVVLMALNGLGLVYQGLERWADARQTLHEAETLARTYGDQRLLAATLANQASPALQSGDARRAVTVLEEAMALDRVTENLPGLAQDLALLGRAREHMGDEPGAQDAYRQARSIARHTGQFLPIGSEKATESRAK